MMRDEAYARALTLAGATEAWQQARLEVLCGAAFAALEARLKDGMVPEDCREAFVTATALEAVATLEEFGAVSEFKAGDLTVKKTGQGNTGRDLHLQAEMLMGPYLKDRFLFAGV